MLSHTNKQVYNIVLQSLVHILPISEGEGRGGEGKGKGEGLYCLK